MVLGCGNKCIKFLVFFFNFLVFVVGAAVLAVSLVVILDKTAREAIQNVLKNAGANISLSQIEIPLYVLAAVGGLLLLTGFLGCCGACMENTCLLGLFFTIVLILFVAELACGIAILVNKNSFKTQVFAGVKDAITKYKTDQTVQKSIDEMQEKLVCCGCEDGVKEYAAIGMIPPSSCKKTGDGYQGCCTKMWNDLEQHAGIAGGVAIGILVIELLAMIFTCILCQAFRRGDYQYA